MKISKYPALLPVIFILCFAPVLKAQEEEAASHTITLTKVVEVYEFEDVKVPVDSYEVRRGDTIADILKARGVFSAAGDEAKMARLIKDLNPDLGDLNVIQPGQLLRLPTAAGEGGEEPAPVSEGAAPETATDTVKIYERRQMGQESAQIVVRRHRPASEAPPQAVDPNDAALSAASALDFPSGNQGPLAMAPDTGVVYRTVKIRRGDTLERLLRREGMDNGLIYARLLKVTLELNPEIRDQNLIFAGAELRIPAAGDYLAGLAGVDPMAVREAALARFQGRRPERAGALELPAADLETAKNTLGLIFTRLGGRIDTRGRLVLPREGGDIEFDTARFPLIELPGERRVVLDLEARLPRDTLRALRNMPGYAVFRPGRDIGKNFRRSLDQLWPLCGFYRVYNKEQRYEGGTDIKLRIAADWMIWPTEAAWKNGQVLALSLAAGPESKTSAAWKGFLARHGVEVLDLYQGALLPDEAAPAAPEPKVTRLTETNPSLLAAEMVKILGAEPRVGVQLDGLATGEGQKSAITAPVLWTHNSRQAVLDFGGLDPSASRTLREEGYLLLTSEPLPGSVLMAVLEGFGLGSEEALVLKAPAGGPAMSITIAGRLASQGGRGLFFTALDLPQGLSALLPPDLEIIRY